MYVTCGKNTEIHEYTLNTLEITLKNIHMRHFSCTFIDEEIEAQRR